MTERIFLLIIMLFCVLIAMEEDNKVDLSRLEYGRYLGEVSDNLMSVPEIQKIVNNLTEDDYKSGKLFEVMKLTPDKVRSVLDEAKRLEVERINQITKGLRKSLRAKLSTYKYSHLDTEDIEHFTETDLSKLLKKTVSDLERLDRIRRRQFKLHELKKRQAFEEKLKHLPPDQRIEAIKRQNEQHERKKRLKDQIVHPGSQAQLRKAWSSLDNLEISQFDPKTFFQLHDTNGDGNLDIYEVGALFDAELSKIYNITDPNYDAIEKDEERNRMREHFMKEYDTNKDGLISESEFLKNYERAKTQDEFGWEPIDSSKEADEVDSAMRHKIPTVKGVVGA